MSFFRPVKVGAAAGLTLVLAAACGTSASSSKQSPSAAADGKVSISVVSLPPGSDKAAFKAFDDQVAIFVKAHPNITVKPQEYEWKGTTFAAQLAGGTLPTVFEVPFTDAQSLIQNKQVADLTDEVNKLPYAKQFNPTVLSEMSSDNKIYALPKGAYGTGLQYNRQLFTQAGLNPDKPPTSWAEVRADAKAISAKTGKAGFAMMGTANTGGWNLTTMTYSLGGRMEASTGGKATATVDNPAAAQALQMLKAMRWEDNSMGSSFLLDWAGMNQAFAAGKVGMYISGSDVYGPLRQSNNIDPKTYGLTALPMSDSSDAALLGGGTLGVVKPTATAAEKSAAVDWMDFYYLSKLTNKDQAIRDAKTTVANKQPVGIPQLPLFDKTTLDTYQGWIKSYIDVPLDQMTGFTSKVYGQNLQPEPANNTQALYGSLDSVVQKVMTDRNADIPAVLKQAQTAAEAIVK